MPALLLLLLLSISTIQAMEPETPIPIEELSMIKPAGGGIVLEHATVIEYFEKILKNTFDEHNDQALANRIHPEGRERLKNLARILRPAYQEGTLTIVSLNPDGRCNLALVHQTAFLADDPQAWEQLKEYAGNPMLVAWEDSEGKEQMIQMLISQVKKNNLRNLLITAGMAATGVGFVVSALILAAAFHTQ